ncbi:hypothetical protein QTQ03_13265 [Micromonospora sp. WMMA1363]|uniref:hypothetical protein n=1 Tax=Micromonospora sp. WMMA1363 TaxID=3053985 RepID=UPI00259CBFD8|nr:hypothetical protein [Micromonospora sp. WMMA1363]MDM4720499.1 hypothetical protein [Micromonospora sp. WMMA1363]
MAGGPANSEEVDVRIRWFRCRTEVVPPLPRRVRGANLPAAWLQPTRALPTQGPGRAGNLTPAQRSRPNGGR